MPDIKKGLIKRLDKLTGQCTIESSVLKHFIDSSTRQETLEKFGFKKDEIEIIMDFKFEDIEGFGIKAYEAFGIPSDMGKERK